MPTMDNQHNSHHTRRANRSSTNLNHLTLAPLTTRMPLDLDDADLPDLPPPPHTTSYLQGKSAPTTPRLLSRSPARSGSNPKGSRSRSDDRRASAPGLLAKKSKSAVHLPSGLTPADTNSSSGHHRRSGTGSRKFTKHGSLTPGAGGLRDREARRDSDWLLRAGALVSAETRESKGQSWLTTRESSTSLVALHATEADAAEAAWERDRAASRAASRASSRRGSIAALEEQMLGSPGPGSRLGSRSHSRVGLSKTPGERRGGGDYFHGVVLPHRGDIEEDEYLREGPDFINIDERLEGVVYGEDGEVEAEVEEEHQVRMLVRREKAAAAGGVSSWFGGVLGWPLFSVQESDEDWSGDEEDGEAADGEDEAEESRSQPVRRQSGERYLEGDGATLDSATQVPPPHSEQGGWQDAAWLLSVATKVIL